MAEVGAVCDVTPVARTPTDIIGREDDVDKMPVPKVKNKWLTASVVDDARTVISSIFEEAQRRDPAHERTWVALVDGAKHQIGSTFDPAQLQLALEGRVSHAYAYSPIVTNLAGPAQAIEAWFRERAQIEERSKDTKLGMALRHLPSGFAVANQVWMWDAFLALTLSATLQAVTGNDHPHRAHGKRLRRELIVVPARVVRHARRLVVRLAPAEQDGPFLSAYQLMRALPTPAG
jgi:hypothetical protein